jgi:tetratricopeptide (TPR) repeat protein
MHRGREPSSPVTHSRRSLFWARAKQLPPQRDLQLIGFVMPVFRVCHSAMPVLRVQPRRRGFDERSHAREDNLRQSFRRIGTNQDAGVLSSATCLEQQPSLKITMSNRQAPQQAPTPPWLWLLLVGAFALVFWQFVPKNGRPNPRPVFASQTWVLLFVGAVVVWLLVVVAVQFFRNFDPGVRRANKRALEGDLDGAIQDLREQIEDKGPTQTRANALGLLLMRCERWAEAAAVFRKAEEIGKFKGVCRANLGLALLKGGKPDEALPVLEEAARVGPQVPAMRCIIGLHSALALAELSRWDEADEQFRVAEEAAGGLRKADRAALNKEFEQCRQKLEQQPREKPKPEGLMEL